MATSSSKAKNQPGSDIVVTTAFELIGIGIMALLAGISNQVGKIVVIIMVGFLLVWMLANTGFMEKYLGKPAPMNSVFAPFTKGMNQ